MAALVTLGWALWAGKDANWDVYNHQLYLPFSLLSGRFQSDFFAAGPQSYQNPVGYLPFYALARSGLPSWQVGVALALLHALAAWPLHLLATAVWGSRPAERPFRLLAVATAWCAPAFLIVAGTTSLDPLCSGLTLAALAAALAPRSELRWMALGGAALGLAIAIKLTGIVFAVALAVVVLVRMATRQTSVRQAAVFTIAALTMLGLSMGGWSIWLWSTFQNPVFPLFNQYFHSPYAPESSIVASRFTPVDGFDYIRRLWVLAELRSYTTTEAFAPDLRFLVASALLAALTAGAAMSARIHLAALGRRVFWSRPDVQLASFTVISYGLWLASSGNSRYGIALFMVVGLVVVRAADCLLPRRAAVGLASLVLALQIAYYVGEGDRRYYPGDWDSKPYFNVVVPDRLVREPYLHLSIGMQSFAAVAPFINQSGALINAVGQLSLPMEGVMGAALKQRLAHWEGRTRFLFNVPPKMDDPEVAANVRSKLDYLTYNLRLGVDWKDCESIHIDAEATPETPRGATTRPRVSSNGTTLWSCRAAPRTSVDAGLEAARARADRVFAMVEKSCPRTYGPSPMVSDLGATVIQRRYMNSEVRVSVSETDGVLLSHFRSPTVVSMGTIDDVLANEGHDACTAWQKMWTP